jgi:hypothetical protein
MSILQGTGYAASFTPSSGATAGLTAILTVTAPDASITTPTVTTTATQFTATVPSTQVGNYLLAWSISGTSATVQQDQFTSIAPKLDFLSLADARAELNYAAGDTAKDDKLRRWLKATTYVIEKVTGPILPVSRTRYFDGDNAFFVLSDRWVTSITSMTENLAGVNYTLTEQPLGSGTDSYGYTWDRSINKIVRRNSNGSERSFPSGPGVVTVTYLAGLVAIPDDIQMAAAALVKHFSSRSDQPFRTSFGPSSGDDSTAVGNYFIPNAIMDLLEPWRRPPGIY